MIICVEFLEIEWVSYRCIKYCYQLSLILNKIIKINNICFNLLITKNILLNLEIILHHIEF